MIALAIFAALCCAGCGGNRVPVSGLVTLDGQPLAAGVIKYVPKTGVDGPTVATKIVNGSYAFDDSDGPMPGDHLVEIHADEAPPEGIDDPEAFLRAGGAKGELAQVRNSIAARFNTATTLSADVTTDGERTFDFEVSRKE